MLLVLYVIIVILIGVLIVGLWQKLTNASCKSKKNLTGKTAIVTGGTSGMGLQIAMEFACRGARVIVACPFIDEGTRGRKQIVERTGNDQVIFKILDLGSLASVRSFVKEVIETEERLDILINNAGIGAGKNTLTDDGILKLMQVNYFGQFLLTLLLLPLMIKTGKASEPSRIVNTSSFLHTFGDINFNYMNSLNHWNNVQLYSNSKLCLLLFTHELSKKLKGKNVIINAIHPGAVGTTIFNNGFGKLFGPLVTFIFKNFSKTPWEGAQTALHVALDKEAGNISGGYYENCRLSRAKSSASDNEISAQLWEESVRLVKLHLDEVEQCLKY